MQTRGRGLQKEGQKLTMVNPISPKKVKKMKERKEGNVDVKRREGERTEKKERCYGEKNVNKGVGFAGGRSDESDEAELLLPSRS